MKNKNLNKACKAKKDEFYTDIADIEKEMQFYSDVFADAVVLCNCDNPKQSNFWRYFHLHFTELHLKKLISVHYSVEQPVYKMEYTGGNDADCTVGVITSLIGNGDFRNAEGIALLQEATIVVTNPPFSLFREYLAQLFEHDKQFIILGNMNAITYKEVFPLIQGNKLWYEPSITSGDRKFYVPDDYSLSAAGCGVEADGRKYIRVKGVRWFTNIDTKRRHKPLCLTGEYTADKYPKYDGYDAINVNKTSDIPKDYMGIMGVPISFMDKYCPDQFEIIGLDRYTAPKAVLVGGRLAINGKSVYARILIRRKV